MSSRNLFGSLKTFHVENLNSPPFTPSPKLVSDFLLSGSLTPDVFGLSNTSPYVEIQWWCGDDVVDLPPHIPMRCWAQHLRPEWTVWPCHTYASDLCRACKKPLYCTEYNCPTSILSNILFNRYVAYFRQTLLHICVSAQTNIPVCQQNHQKRAKKTKNRGHHLKHTVPTCSNACMRSCINPNKIIALSCSNWNHCNTSASSPSCCSLLSIISPHPPFIMLQWKRGYKFAISEVESLLKVIDEISPIGNPDLERVWNNHLAHYPTKEWTTVQAQVSRACSHKNAHRWSKLSSSHP